MISRPEPNEYAPFYAGYINQVPDGDVVQVLEALKDSTHKLLAGLPPEKGDHAYAPGKWTIKQLVNHMIDAERIFAYRILSFARGDQNALPGFDEVDYAEKANIDNRTLRDLADEFKAVREANLYLYRSISEEQSQNTGTASNNTISVRALLYISAGHEMHHIKILQERYL